MANTKKDFINQLEENIDDDMVKKSIEQTSSKIKIDKSDTTSVLAGGKIKVKRKISDKTNKKNFNIYMENDIVNALDKFAKKSGYSRNELIGMACRYFVENSELED